jgi:hypothetical protein
MCRILGVSRAQYYRYRSPKPSKRRAEDVDLKQRILRIFAEFKQRYGVIGCKLIPETTFKRAYNE